MTAAMLAAEAIGVCARCGCTEERRCIDADDSLCVWVRPGLCSVCASRSEPTAARSIPLAELLEFERTHPGISARKAEQVRRTFGLSFAQWTQQLRVAVDTRGALEHDALLAHHLSDRIHGQARRRAALISRRRS